jgi:hypothetical protein
MKPLLIALLLPFGLQAVCSDCSFPYHIYARQYQTHYENAALQYSTGIIDIEDLKTAREKAIFYSGGAFSLRQISHEEWPY